MPDGVAHRLLGILLGDLGALGSSACGRHFEDSEVVHALLVLLRLCEEASAGSSEASGVFQW